MLSYEFMHIRESGAWEERAVLAWSGEEQSLEWAGDKQPGQRGRIIKNVEEHYGIESSEKGVEGLPARG